MKLSITTAGLEFLLKSLQGGPSPEFCKIAFGNGNDAGKNATEMSNIVKELDIYSITRKEDYVSLVGILNNSEITESFKATELGIYITDPTNATGVTLYAYGYSPEDEAALIPAASDYPIETEETIMVYVGSVEDVKAVLSDSSLYASKVVVEEMKQTVDVLAPPIYETQIVTGVLPDEEYQFQNTATIIDGYYANCGRGLLQNDNLKGIYNAEGCSLAIIPVQAGEKYTVFFPGVTSTEVVLNATTLKTFKDMFLGFGVLQAGHNLDINTIDIDSINIWLEESNILLNGYGDCTENGAGNPDKFNSGYYFSFTAPEGADTVIFNVALSENADARKVYNYKDSFLFFKGFYSELPSEEIRLLYQLGKCIIKDLEGRNLIDGLTLSVKSFSEFITLKDISNDFITPKENNSSLRAENVSVFKQGNIVSGSCTIVGNFEEASGSDLLWTINNEYKPSQSVFACQGVMYSADGDYLETNCPYVVIDNGVLYVSEAGLGSLVSKIEISFSYICV